MGIANTGTLSVDLEESLGTAAGSPVDVRFDSIELNRTTTRYLQENHIGGHYNPYSREKPIPFEKCSENAFSITDRIRRPTANDGTPIMQYLLESAAINHTVSDNDTTITGTPAVDSIEMTANITNQGDAVLVEQSTDFHVPMLVADETGSVLTPMVDFAAVPSVDDAITQMHTFSLATNSTKPYVVESDKTLTCRYNSHGRYSAAYGDFSILYSGCACGSIDTISLKINEYPTIKYNMHAAKIDIAANTIGAESFNDSAQYVLINDDFFFSFANTDVAGGVTLTSKKLVSAEVMLNHTVTPMWATGGGTYGGIVGYRVEPASPTIHVRGYFEGDSGLENEMITQLETLASSTADKCIKIAQPTRNLDVPALGIWAPRCHLAPGDESFKADMIGGENGRIAFDATFVCNVTGLDSTTTVTSTYSSPVYIGISSEAA